MKQMTDTAAIESAVDAVLAANPDKVEEVRAFPKAAAWFVGQGDESDPGKSNPQVVNAILRRRLNLPDEG
jgi:aspartyl-tRNA(Asn)/glutamyl-tRNA(Gln) amidotransferase subunit B